MHILIACEDLRIGGAQVFALRLANAMRQHHQVTVYSLYPDLIDKELVNKYAASSNIEVPIIPLDWFIRKVDRLLYLLKIDVNVRNIIAARYIRKIILKKGVDVVHSNMFKCDYLMAKALRGTNVPLVVTMHGNYEEFLSNYEGSTNGEILLNYLKKVSDTARRIDGIVYLTSKNLDVFKKSQFKKDHIIFRKIYNGFAGEVTETVSREKLGITSDSIVYGFVARGIPEKGWKTVLDAFVLLNNNNDHLVLVGWSDYVESLANAYKHDNIHFIGSVGNALNWIALIDIGVLPSVFHESLPNVIAEYLYLGKAVVCTDVGDSKNMITYGNEYAGFVLDPLSATLAEDLAGYLKRYKADPGLLQKHQQLATKAFEKFKMDECLVSYLNIYKQLVDARS